MKNAKVVFIGVGLVMAALLVVALYHKAVIDERVALALLFSVVLAVGALEYYAPG
jgi:uncharacterized membrane protein